MPSFQLSIANDNLIASQLCQINFQNQLSVKNIREHPGWLVIAHSWPISGPESMWWTQKHVCQPLSRQTAELHPHSCWPTDSNSSRDGGPWSFQSLQPWWFDGCWRSLRHARTWLAACNNLFLPVKSKNGTQVSASNFIWKKPARGLWSWHLVGGFPFHYQI